ncbi:MAG: glycoside hydrolase family 76 protein [Ignavibacteriaceae bacterium]
MEISVNFLNHYLRRLYCKMHPKIIFLFLFISTLSINCQGLDNLNNAIKDNNNPNWAGRADSSQAALERYFWNSSQSLYYSNSGKNTDFNYWWQAHALDVLVDGFIRTGNSGYVNKIVLLYKGIAARNNGGFIAGYYDDMAWMALAMLRAYEKTGVDAYNQVVHILWNDIKTGWDNTFGGGIFWRKKPRDFKDVAANAPAIILACRLYREFGNNEDLEWAKKIHSWLKATLIDSNSGIIWDGISLQGNEVIVQREQYTYNYGTYLGACLELYKIGKDTSYLNEAVKTANIAENSLVTNGILKDEGGKDGGLFKGIYVRYLVQLVLEPTLNESLKNNYKSFLNRNAESLWHKAQNPGVCLFNHDWQAIPVGDVDLSSQLGAMMLLEGEALLEHP